MVMRNRYQAAFFLYIAVAFLGGTAIPELIRMGNGTYSGFTSIYSFQLYGQLEVRQWDLFRYILKIRIPTLLFLWMSTYTAAGLLFHIIYAGWLAASAGMLLSLFVLRDGYEGILLLSCCLFPQWILYATVLKQEAGILIRRNTAKSSIPAVRSSLLYQSDLWELGNLMLLCVVGCACEAFLGTWTLKIFLQFSV